MTDKAIINLCYKHIRNGTLGSLSQITIGLMIDAFDREKM